MGRVLESEVTWSDRMLVDPYDDGMEDDLEPREVLVEGKDFQIISI